MTADNQATAKEEHYNAIGKHLPEGFQAASEPLDISPIVKQIQQESAATKPAMLNHLRQRRRLVLAKQVEIASRYNAEFERLQQEEAGARVGCFTDLSLVVQAEACVCTGHDLAACEACCL